MYAGTTQALLQETLAGALQRCISVHEVPLYMHNPLGHVLLCRVLYVEKLLDLVQPSIDYIADGEYNVHNLTGHTCCMCEALKLV